jgi:undecaprenyldiphospho-muramoylpentapeptide beta-N-acetylglucosaminyltransferase
LTDGHDCAVVIAGGGTGGHVFPAIALADALVADGIAADAIRFVGARRGLEATAVPAAGYEITLLPGRGIARSLTLANVGAVVENLRAVGRAFSLLRRVRPRVVVGVGGFASVPCILAAFVLRIPMVIHEQNAAPGVANRLAARLGAQAAVAWPGTPLRRAVVTGNPVRPDILSCVRAPARSQVAIMGGSLGARRINEAALACYDRWRDRTDLTIVHLTGIRNFDDCEARLQAMRRDDDRLDYQMVAFESDMASCYANTTLVVGRAGAVTVAELAAVGMPAILIPLPNAPGDHQGANARALVRAGAAVIIPDAECNGARLGGEIDQLLSDGSRLTEMSRAAVSIAKPDAATALAALVRERMRRAR